jgi:hypothetical protein
MELLINNVKHSWDKELEIFNNDKGFDITIKYKSADELDDFYKRRADKIVTMHNCTEFHHMHDYESYDEILKEILDHQEYVAKTWAESGVDRASVPMEKLVARAKKDYGAMLSYVSSAFESDIHSCGCTKDVVLLAYIHVVDATVIHDNY